MNTWNTITRTSLNKLDEALLVLETLSDELCLKIMDYLKSNHSASFLDLTIHTRLDSSSLEECLEALCATKIITQKSSIYQTKYFFDVKRYQKIARLVKLLN